MKIETKELEVTTNTEMRTYNLKVSQDSTVIPIIIKMMADQYKNPLKTLSVEYVQNAMDSHRVAGKLDVPIQIHLPNSNDPYFRVRDFGISMSSETVENVFSALFASTKRDSDEDIGGFGVGRLVFGAYTGTMVITTYLDGKKTEYFFYLENGKGDITEMMAVDSDEPQGVEISIPIKEHDFENLRRICQEQYAFIKPTPIVTGNHQFTLKNVQYKFVTDSFCFRDKTDRYTQLNPIATVAGLPYPIDPYQFDYEHCTRRILSSGVVLHFNVGEVDIVPSRDNLKYTDKTKNAIEEKIKEIEDLAKVELDKLCDTSNIKTEYEARCMWYKLFNSGTLENFLVSLLPNKNYGFKYNNDIIDGYRKEIPFTPDKDYKHRRIYKLKMFEYAVENNRLNGTETDYVKFIPDSKIIWGKSESSPRIVSQKIKHYLIDEDLNYVYVVKDINDGYTIDDFCDDTAFDKSMIVSIDDIELPKRTTVKNGGTIVRNPRHIQKRVYYFIGGSRYSFDKKCWSAYNNLDLQDTEGFWVVKDGSDIRGMDLSPRAVKYLLKEYNDKNNTGYKIWSILPSKVSQVGPKMLNLVDEFKKLIPELIKKYFGANVPMDLLKLYDEVYNEHNYIMHNKDLLTDVESTKWFFELQELVLDYKKTKKLDDIETHQNRLVQIAPEFDITINAQTQSTSSPEFVKYNTLYDEYKKEFKIIDNLSYYSHTRIAVIKLIDENKSLKKRLAIS